MAQQGQRRDHGRCGIGCLIVFLISAGFLTFYNYAQCPELFDSDDVVNDIYRYRERFGKWPQNLNEIKKKLPDYEFDWAYDYYYNEKMFMVAYNCECDYAYFYRSDTEEWKEYCKDDENEKEYQELTSTLVEGAEDLRGSNSSK